MSSTLEPPPCSMVWELGEEAVEAALCDDSAAAAARAGSTTPPSLPQHHTRSSTLTAQVVCSEADSCTNSPLGGSS